MWLKLLRNNGALTPNACVCAYVCSGTLLPSLLHDVQVHSHKECSVRVFVRMSLLQVWFACFDQPSCSVLLVYVAVSGSMCACCAGVVESSFTLGLGEIDSRITSVVQRGVHCTFFSRAVVLCTARVFQCSARISFCYPV